MGLFIVFKLALLLPTNMVSVILKKKTEYCFVFDCFYWATVDQYSMLWENRVKRKYRKEWENCQTSDGMVLRCNKESSWRRIKKISFSEEFDQARDQMHLTKYQVLTNPKTLTTIQNPPQFFFNWGVAEQPDLC